ncbi:MAG: PDZ domain-containing protein [Sulfurimonas sp.]|nr:PDZ domain-containing protein [Sulfurimonas sp.]
MVGFKVNRIKANSKMATLGLQKGDVITKANNIELKSFKDALDLYKKIDKIETISLVILRNNQEREIIYDIH